MLEHFRKYPGNMLPSHFEKILSQRFHVLFLLSLPPVKNPKTGMIFKQASVQIAFGAY